MQRATAEQERENEVKREIKFYPDYEELMENRMATKVTKALRGQRTPPTKEVIKMQSQKSSDYYRKCAFPKPQDKKKKKKVNGYKDKPDRMCAYTGRPYAERHEIFCGRNRQISIDYGFQIDVCPEIHEELQANITEWAQAENQRLRQKCQTEYEDKLIAGGITTEQAHECWLKLIGRSYI